MEKCDVERLYKGWWRATWETRAVMQESGLVGYGDEQERFEGCVLQRFQDIGRFRKQRKGTKAKKPPPIAGGGQFKPVSPTVSNPVQSRFKPVPSVRPRPSGPLEPVKNPSQTRCKPVANPSQTRRKPEGHFCCFRFIFVAAVLAQNDSFTF